MIEKIERMIVKENGFFRTDSELTCPECNQPHVGRFVTKSNGICLPCFLGLAFKEGEKNKLEEIVKELDEAIELSDSKGFIVACETLKRFKRLIS